MKHGVVYIQHSVVDLSTYITSYSDLSMSLIFSFDWDLFLLAFRAKKTPTKIDEKSLKITWKSNYAEEMCQIIHATSDNVQN